MAIRASKSLITESCSLGPSAGISVSSWRMALGELSSGLPGSMTLPFSLPVRGRHDNRGLISFFLVNAIVAVVAAFR